MSKQRIWIRLSYTMYVYHIMITMTKQRIWMRLSYVYHIMNNWICSIIPYLQINPIIDCNLILQPPNSNLNLNLNLNLGFSNSMASAASSSSSSRMSCFQCQDSTFSPANFRNGWRLRSGEFAPLCPRCASVHTHFVQIMKINRASHVF